MATAPILQLAQSQIADFCRRWKIRELAVFGSAARDELRAESDIDLLITFAPEGKPRFRDLLRMEDELSRLLGRKIDLVDRRTLEKSENYIIRQSILRSALPIYAEP